MQQRRLGGSGFMVPAFSFGTGTFGGKGEFFRAWGDTDAKAARRMIDLCLEAGVNMFDSADLYSGGAAEEILGAALRDRPRDRLIISTKAAFRVGEGANAVGASRYHLVAAVEAALTRLRTDYIDLFQLHRFDGLTPPEEALSALDQLVRQGKIRYTGVSNYSGWQLMKGQAVAERYGYPKFVAHQVYYSLIGRDYEHELMPLAADQGVGAIVWSPLGWGRLTGRIRRGQGLPPGSRLHKTADAGPPLEDEYVYQVVDALDAVAAETGRSVPQVALNWLLQRPTVASIIIGARDETQLRENLGAIGWALTAAQVGRLDEASARPLPYPYWHQADFTERNPPLLG